MSVQVPTCPDIPAKPTTLSIRFPGGLKISSLPSLEDGVLTDLGAVQSLLSQMGPALAGLQPVFTLVKAVTSVFEVLGAIPTIATDPVGFYEKLKEATKAISDLAGLHPAVAVPFLVLDSINVLTASLRALRDQVVILQQMATEADQLIAQAQSLGDANLEAMGNCKKQIAEALGAHAGAALGPLGQLLEVMRSLMELTPTGGGSLPSLGDASGETLDDLVTLLDSVISVLEAISF